MANRRGDTLWQEGRYRRTASPQTAKKSAALLSQMAELSRQQVNLQQLAQPPPTPLQATQAAAHPATAAEGDLVAEHNLSVGASVSRSFARSHCITQKVVMNATIDTHCTIPISVASSGPAVPMGIALKAPRSAISTVVIG